MTAMIGQRTWSTQKWMIVILASVCVWFLFALVSPGGDYVRCYTWLVMHPEWLPRVATEFWTFAPPWTAIFMSPFVTLPGRAGLIAFMGATIAMTLYATSVYGGRPLLVLLSGQMMWLLWWGTVEGWGILGLAIGWYALQRKSWPLMFLALVISSFKPQGNFVPVLMLWWWLGKDRWKALAAGVVLFLLSLVIWGPWPMWYLQGLSIFVNDRHTADWNISIGLVALPLFIPALLTPLDKEKRLIALCATSYLVSPYMPYYSSLPLLVFALPLWAYIFAFTSYLPGVIGTLLAWNGVMLLPITVLIWVYLPPIRRWIQSRRAVPAASGPPPAEGGI